MSCTNLHYPPTNSKLLLFAGPCQIESLDHALKIASEIKRISEKLPVDFVYKSSFDKANRTSISGKRGVGIDEGMEILYQVKKQIDVPIVTDIHLPQQVSKVAEIADVLQIPAFLCRQTDLLIEAGKSNRIINVKKGQFLAPSDMRFVTEKILSTNNNKIILCERGTSFGYRDLVVDMRGLVIMQSLGFPVMFDATHSVQVVGGDGTGSSGGNREFIKPLLLAACAVGINGIFLECHDNPTHAPSDGASMLPLNELEGILAASCKVWETSKSCY